MIRHLHNLSGKELDFINNIDLPSSYPRAQGGQNGREEENITRERETTMNFQTLPKNEDNIKRF